MVMEAAARPPVHAFYIPGIVNLVDYVESPMG